MDQESMYIKEMIRKDILFAFILAVLVGVFLHWPAFQQSDRMHENWRQSPHWTSPHTQQFQPDDLLIRYAQFNTSPFSNWLYKNLARTGIDIFWGKFFAVLFFSITTLLIFITGQAMAGSACGWIAISIFMFFPAIFKEFSGGFMSAFSAPFLCLTVFVIYRKKWKWAVPIMLIEAVSYPMAAIHSGMIFLVDILAHDTRTLLDRNKWKNKYIWLSIAAALGIALISLKYIGSSHEFGKLVTRTEISNLKEFTWKGRSALIPVPSLWHQFSKQWGDFFHLGLFLIPYIFLTKDVFKLPRGLYQILSASIIMYILADIFLFRLYFPDRYLHFSLPIFTALAGGFWWAQLFEKKPIKRTTILVLALLIIATGIYEFHETLRPGRGTIKLNRHDLYTFIRAIPDRPMIAVHPNLGSEIPLMTGKSVLVSRELSHPWWTAYWKTIHTRTQDLFQAYYTTDPQVLKNFIQKYNIDYWIIQPKYFAKKYLRKKRRIYMEPFNRWIKKNLRPGKKALLNQIPAQYRLFDNGKFYVVSSEGIIQWLNLSDTTNRSLPEAN
jgi:energy-converting hydrogenase Eha subunit A